jgi:CRISPR-associated protein Cmr2
MTDQHKAFWQAKIWGLLHDPALKGLHASSQLGQEGAWQHDGLPYLQCMEGWVSPKFKSKKSPYKEIYQQSERSRQWLDHVGLCDLLSSASDRCTVGRLPLTASVTYGDEGLQIRHLLSGEPYPLKLNDWHDNIKTGATGKTKFIQDREKSVIPEEIRGCPDARKVFWWFWRCFPEALAKYDAQIQLLPAETRLPDASLWSHTSLTAALAGSLAGYYKTEEEYPKKGAGFKGKESRPHVAVFTFTPVQELIKASRKLRDFWAGSWLLHYLSAKACWDLAWKYGPDTLLYPCLYAQPLIDYWLLKEYPDFKKWVDLPDQRSLLTAGFPNVIVAILPDNAARQESKNNPVYAAMQQVRQGVLDEWDRLGSAVLEKLQKEDRRKSHSWRDILPSTWQGWLKSQWQTYWVALPIGSIQTSLDCSPRDRDIYKVWSNEQNQFASPKNLLFPDQEYRFLEAVFHLPSEDNGDLPEIDLEEDNKDSKKKFEKQPNMNVGSWWASLFDQARRNLNAVKNARSWELPTAKAPRSSLSGVGSVVHPIFNDEHPQWLSESEANEFWAESLGLFNSTEKMNATETLKRTIHEVLSTAIFQTPVKGGWRKFIYAPDLSSGTAGWLRYLEQQGDPKGKIQQFEQVCDRILNKFSWASDAAEEPWGIPWIDRSDSRWHDKNPRLINAGWLIEEYKTESKEAKKEQLRLVKHCIQETFKEGDNPTDWYVIAAGDGDSMSKWLEGDKSLMKSYGSYIPDDLLPKIDRLDDSLKQPFNEFLGQTKRMSPSTHSALSRALLDFSNQLVPYLTEQRYAGRLIYGGGDDVLAYTNLWEWDQWLWDVRECFKGSTDPHGEFDNSGDYWRWKGEESKSKGLSKRPLFTMGSKATISFGIVIAHHSVPLAIALESMWEAEEEAKEHEYVDPEGKQQAKDAVQVRVIYGNGNILKATCKFKTFSKWQALLQIPELQEPALFEQAATAWEQHPVPVYEAIAAWVTAFCDRREKLNEPTIKETFQKALTSFLDELWIATKEDKRDREVQNWLKLAAFMLRKRDIKINL